MIVFFSKKISISKLKKAAFVFAGLLLFSGAIFVFADDNTVSSNNIFQDTDQDDLSNDEEKLYGTDPDKADTDSDGYTDGAEVKSGYDPTKPAPGDKIVQKNSLSQNQNIPNETLIAAESQALTEEGKDEEEVNLTQQMTSEIVEMVQNGSVSDTQVSLDEIKNSVQKLLDTNMVQDNLPQVDMDSIKVKKQKYTDLSSEARDAKIKEDTLGYLTTIAYIFASNSPVPLHSTDDLSTLFSSFSTQSLNALLTGDTSSLNDFIEKQTQTLEQLKDVEVPENMLETHVKALQLSLYALSLKDEIEPHSDDPLAMVAMLAKVRGLATVAMNFVSDVQVKLDGYGIKEIPIEL